MARRQEWWQRDASASSQQWAKSEHLVRMQQSGHFRYVKEVVLHHPGILESGTSATEVGLDELRQVAQRTLGIRSSPRISIIACA
jgi:hypothetical protein